MHDSVVADYKAEPGALNMTVTFGSHFLVNSVFITN
jgi:hypothetical protein